jgi:hypothetical protein
MKTRPAPVRFQGLFGRHSLSLSFLSKQRLTPYAAPTFMIAPYGLAFIIAPYGLAE